MIPYVFVTQYNNTYKSRLHTGITRCIRCGLDFTFENGIIRTDPASSIQLKHWTVRTITTSTVGAGTDYHFIICWMYKGHLNNNDII